MNQCLLFALLSGLSYVPKLLLFLFDICIFHFVSIWMSSAMMHLMEDSFSFVDVREQKPKVGKIEFFFTSHFDFSYFG